MNLYTPNGLAKVQQIKLIIIGVFMLFVPTYIPVILFFGAISVVVGVVAYLMSCIMASRIKGLTR